MVHRTGLLAALTVVLLSSSAWSQGFGNLGQDIYRAQIDQYRTGNDYNQLQGDRSRLYQDLNSGNYAGAVSDEYRLQRDRQQLSYDRVNTQIDGQQIQNDLSGGYYGQPAYQPQGGFIYSGGQFVTSP